MGVFQNGQVFGPFWIGLIRSGYIYGIADGRGSATGNDTAFIYADGVTALKGYFEVLIFQTNFDICFKS